MRHVPHFPLLAAVALTLAACASTPPGPSTTALPGTGKSFDQFRIDDSDCRQYSQSQTGNGSNQAGVNSGVKSAAIGTGVGALAGLALGGTGRGAATGAGIGLLFGSVAGAGAADRSAGNQQSRYDAAYTQCMYAKGNKVAVSGYGNGNGYGPGYVDQGAATIPPPPPGPPPGPPMQPPEQSYAR